MKKVTVLLYFILLLILLSGCGLRERLLAPPDEYTVPEGSLVAECTKDDNTYKFIFQDDGVYQYFINGEEQDEEAVSSIIEQAYIYGSSVENYLNSEYPSSCIITDYIAED